MMLRSPKCVLYLDNSFTFGGAINALADLLSAIDRERFQPVLLSAQNERFLGKYFHDVPARHWDARLPWIESAIQRRMARWPGLARGRLRRFSTKARAARWFFSYELPEAFRIARFARRQAVDLIHLNNGVESLGPGLLAAKLLGIPAVAHSRGPQTWTPLARLYAKAIDHWIAVSGCMATNLLDGGVDQRRITVVHDAVNLDVFREASPPKALRAQLDIPVNAPVFGVFGRIVAWKGIREFILAAKAVLLRIPDAYALIVGDRSDGSQQYYDDVVALCRQLGIADRVVLTGFRTDVADLMRLCDVVVHTSIEPEPFGLTVVEAMATGKPVVAANSGGPLETVVEEETGLLVDPMDTPALSDAIVRLLQHPELVSAMGRKGAIRARALFAPARYARDVETVYNRVLGKPD